MTRSPGTGLPVPPAQPILAPGPAVPWLASLAPSEEGRSIVPASSAAQIARAVRAAGADAAQWAVEIGHDVAERVQLEIPAHAGDGGFDVLRMGTESTALQLLIVLSGTDVDSAVTSESLGGIPGFVRHRVSLDELLRGIQLGHSIIAAAFLAECGRLGDPEQRHEQMRTLSQRMFAFFDVFSTQMAASYREEEGRWAHSDASARLAVVEDLLRGHELDPRVISRRLRYDLSRGQLAVIVWSSARTLEADQQALYEASSELMRQAGAEQRLVLSAGVGRVWAWASPKGDPRELLDRLSAVPLPLNTHAAFGGAGTGIAGFRASHEEAEAVFRLRSVLQDPPETTAYHEVDLLSLLLADRERALRFARRELGALADSAPATVELRRTLAMYLEEQGSPHAAGHRLMVSRNTVTYRVRRAEELLGRPIATRRAQLQAALTILAECER
ncbi:MAG: PucR family transcriptional regulator [Leucobacter sp.]